MRWKPVRLAATLAAAVAVVVSTAHDSGDAADKTAQACVAPPVPPVRECRRLSDRASEIETAARLSASEAASLAEAEALLRTAAAVCARVDEWIPAQTLADRAAVVGADRVQRGDDAPVRRADPAPCAADTDAVLFEQYADSRRAAALAALTQAQWCVGETAEIPAMTETRRRVDAARCAWLADASARRAELGAQALETGAAVDALMAMSGALSALNEARAQCPMLPAGGVNRARQALAGALTVMRSGALPDGRTAAAKARALAETPALSVPAALTTPEPPVCASAQLTLR